MDGSSLKQDSAACVEKTIRAIARERILLLDGATGTMIQGYGLGEADYRGERFADWPKDLKGDNDLLCLTRSDVVTEIHHAFLEAGADIIETNSFNGTTISQADYGMQEMTDEINRAAARIARKVADTWTERTPLKPRFVAGAIGPTNKTLSVSPRVDAPGYRDIGFDAMKDAYKRQGEALLKGGADLLLIETVFDTLNAKAALVAVKEIEAERATHVPVVLSVTITDMSGRNLSGQTVEAFWHSVRHARPLAVGLNCAFGAGALRPHATALAKAADTLVCVYPNAGLPNEMGEYDETPEQTAAHLAGFARDGLVNIVGGCCGTTPAHIRAIAEAVKDIAPRSVPEIDAKLRLSGLEAVSF